MLSYRNFACVRTGESQDFFCCFSFSKPTVRLAVGTASIHEPKQGTTACMVTMARYRYANYNIMNNSTPDAQPASTTVQSADMKSFAQSALSADSSEYQYDTPKEQPLDAVFGKALKGIRIDRLLGQNGNFYNNATVIVEVTGFAGKTFQKSVPVRLWKGRDADALPERSYTAEEAKGIKCSFAFNAAGYRSDDGVQPTLYLNMLPEGVDPNAQ